MIYNRCIYAPISNFDYNLNLMKTMINYSKLIGHSIDTNQVKSDGLIKSENEAKMLIDNIIGIYGELMFENMYLFGKMFTAYTYGLDLEGKITLSDYFKL